ncbi:MAG TPA: efflux RND transporter periplasmic adaptor subunit [Candidatus Nitrosotalea sp.]|nr:efflux RND transporter periplasmic adaptor subunit [Candidatus Nitrosotalea sp.]
MARPLIPNITAQALLLTLIGAVCGCKKSEGPPPTPPTVEVVTVAQRDVPIYREWVGTLEGDVNATISAQVSGYLLTRNYTEGSVVTNGQVLFQIDPGPFKATLDQAKSDEARAEATQVRWALTVERYKPLAATEAISKQELDDAVQNEKAAQAQVEATKAAVQQAQLNLDFTTIRAPVNGVAGLASAQAQVGNLVGPASGSLTTVTTIDPIRAYISVSQQMMTDVMERRLKDGKKLREGPDPEAGVELELILANGSVYPIKGKVRFANNQVDVKTGTIRIVGEFRNPQSLLVAGLFVRVRALLETQKNVLVVPQRVVTDMQGRYLVAIVGADNKVSIRPVNAGERSGQDWVISGDIKAGDRVVAEGVQKVREGATVNPVPFEEKKVGAPTAAAEEKR